MSKPVKPASLVGPQEEHKTIIDLFEPFSSHRHLDAGLPCKVTHMALSPLEPQAKFRHTSKNWQGPPSEIGFQGIHKILICYTIRFQFVSFCDQIQEKMQGGKHGPYNIR
jgi:hypothetical protein